jgi:hypothetical protein
MYITDVNPALCTAHSRLLLIIRASLAVAVFWRVEVEKVMVFDKPVR